MKYVYTSIVLMAVLSIMYLSIVATRTQVETDRNCSNFKAVYVMGETGQVVNKFGTRLEIICKGY